MHYFHRTLFTFSFLIVLSLSSFSRQQQTVRGTVLDILLQSPVAGATVSIGDRKTTTNENGEFKFSDISIGSYTIRVSSIGFQEVTLDNILVNAGKENVLNIQLEKHIRQEAAVLVKAKSKKNNPLNDMSVVSSRAFTWKKHSGTLPQ